MGGIITEYDQSNVTITLIIQLVTCCILTEGKFVHSQQNWSLKAFSHCVTHLMTTHQNHYSHCCLLDQLCHLNHYHYLMRSHQNLIPVAFLKDHL